MRQGRENTEEVKCVYQNIGPTSQAKADNIVTDSIFFLQVQILAIFISMAILHHEVLDQVQALLSSHHFIKSFLEGSLRKKTPV